MRRWKYFGYRPGVAHRWIHIAYGRQMETLCGRMRVHDVVSLRDWNEFELVKKCWYCLKVSQKTAVLADGTLYLPGLNAGASRGGTDEQQ